MSLLNKNPELEIRDKLAGYLAGEMALDVFEDWFALALLKVNEIGNAAAIDLAYGIELLLAEFSGGYWTEGQLHKILLPFVQSYTVGEWDEIHTASFSTVTNRRVFVWCRMQPAHSQLEVAFS